MAEFTPKTDKVKDICKKLRPFLGKQADQLFLAYLAEDTEGKTQMENYLEVLLVQHIQDTLDEDVALLIPPSAGEAAGSYTLGQILYAGRTLFPFGLRENEWIQHVGVFGRSGAGKTNLGFIIFRELLRKDKPVLVFDWKRNYRDLLILPEFKNVEVYTIGRNIAPLAFNPLIPPSGTKPKTWLKKLIEVIAHAYLLGNGVMYLLQQALDSVYEQFGVYSGRVLRYPTFRDVLDRLKHYDARGREAGWLSSTLRALSSLCFGDMDTLVNQGDNEILEYLLTKPVILELDALTQSDKVFFIQALLLWVHHRRMAEGTREQFKHAIIIEEAHHILSGERGSLIGGQSVMEITFREIREFGESLIILDQHPSQISLPALGNTYCTISMNLKHSKDVNAIAQCMLLSDKEKSILGTLEVGQAVVKLQGRTARPFLMQIPEFDIKKGAVSDDSIRKQMLPALSLISSIRPGLLNSCGVQPKGNNSGANNIHRKDDLLLEFLRDVRDDPESGIANRYSRLGISVRQGQKLKAALVEAGLIQEAKEHTETGTIRKIRLTEKGERFIFNTSNLPSKAQD